MKTSDLWRALCLCLCGWVAASCVEYDALPFEGKTLPRKSGYTTGVTNDWLYFNLRTGEIFNLDAPNRDITEGEQTARTDWDLAFCGYSMRTNSGTSGIGKGGAADLGRDNSYESWTRLSQLPTGLDWAVDDSTVYVTMSQNDWNKYLIAHDMDFDANPWFDPNNGPKIQKVSGNPVLSRSMSFAGPPPVYTPSFHTYVVRTTDGERYFKIQIISWYDANVEIGDEGGRMSYYCDELN